MQRVHRLWLWLVVACVWLGAMGVHAAPAEGRHRVAVLPIAFEGKLEDHWRAQLTEQVITGLARGRLDIVGPDDVTKATGGVAKCSNPACFKFAAESTQSRYVVHSVVKVELRDYTVTLKVVDGRDGAVVAESSEGCQLCGVAEVGEIVNKQAAVVRQKIDALSLAPAVLLIESDPEGAAIEVDGKAVGNAPLEHIVVPGKHRIRVTHPGFLPRERDVTAVQGIREPLSVRLEPDLDGSSRKRDWKKAAWPAGWALLGVGVPTLATGIAFVAIDENPFKSQCSGEDVDAEGDCRLRYNSTIPGAVLTGVGAAFVITGTALVIAARPGKRKRGRSKARAQVLLRPGGLAVRGRF